MSSFSPNGRALGKSRANGQAAAMGRAIYWGGSIGAPEAYGGPGPSRYGAHN